MEKCLFTSLWYTQRGEITFVGGKKSLPSFCGCVFGWRKTESHFAQSGPMAEAVLLGTIAIRVPDQLLTWDSAKMKFPNYPAAEKFLKRTYRKGWEVKGF